MDQALDLQGFAQMIRRRKRIVVAFAAAGLLLGVAFALLRPPMPAAQALVLLPPSSASVDPDSHRDVGTAVVVAKSSPVLEDATDALHLEQSAPKTRRQVTVRAISDDVLSVVARDRNGRRAVRLANAVSDAYVAFETSADHEKVAAAVAVLEERATKLREQVAGSQRQIDEAMGRVASEAPQSAEGERDSTLVGSLRNEQAQLSVQLDDVSNRISDLRVQGALDGGATRVLQRATTAVDGAQTRTPLWGIGGLALGMLVGSLVAAVIDRSDRRLRRRLDIAIAVGAPVVASVVTEPARTMEEHRHLLEHHEPAVAVSWTLKRMLRGLAQTRIRRVRVLTISHDAAAVVASIDLALTASADKTDTTFVVEGDDPTTLPLRAACHALAMTGRPRPHLSVWERGAQEGEQRRDSLTITMVPVGDGAEAAGLALVPERTATVLVVSAGFATAEQLARAAMLAADSGSMVMGIIVADPDPADQTTGSSEDPTVTVLSAHKRTPTQLQRSAT